MKDGRPEPEEFTGGETITVERISRLPSFLEKHNYERVKYEGLIHCYDSTPGMDVE